MPPSPFEKIIKQLTSVKRYWEAREGSRLLCHCQARQRIQSYEYAIHIVESHAPKKKRKAKKV